MTDASDQRLTREFLTLTPARPAKLSIARRNTALLVAFLYLQDIFFLSVSRIQLSYSGPMYIVSRFEWPLFWLFVVIAILFAIVGMIAAQVLKPLRKIKVSRRFISGIILLAILLNILTFLLLVGNARYVSGALTGKLGVLYGVSRALTLASIVLFILRKKDGSPFSKILFFSFTGSLLVSLDGLASALTLGMFLVLILDVRIRRPIRLIVLMALGSGLFWMGFNLKFTQIPDYVTPEFMFRWTLARFSIQAEQMYTFIAGESVIGDKLSYLDLIFRAISDRFDLVAGRPLSLVYPRSVGEATFYDITGNFDGGSSPGALLSTAYMGPFFFIVVPFFYAFLFLQFFYGIDEKVTFVQLCAYSFVFKSVHSNFSEYLTIISPTLLVVAVFGLSCLLTPNTSRAQTR